MSRLLAALRNLQESEATKSPGASEKVSPRLAASIRRAVLGKDPEPTATVATVLFSIPEVTGDKKPAGDADLDPIRRPDPMALVDSISASLDAVSKADAVPHGAIVPPAVSRPSPSLAEQGIFSLLADGERSAQYRQFLQAAEKDAGSAKPTIIALAGIDARTATASVAATLATLWAEQRSERVLAIDTDAQSRLLSGTYAASQAQGLAEFLAGRTPNPEISFTSHERLDLLAFGQASAAQAQLLPVALREALPKIATGYDCLVIDAGPLDSPWAKAASEAATATYLLVRLGQTPAESAIMAVNRFRTSGGRLTGCVALGTD